LNLGLSLGNIGNNHVFLLITPLALSAIIHLWNPSGFPFPAYDEGTYLGRSVYLMEGLGPQEPYSGYDHPYFGHLFLASLFSVIGYPDSLDPSSYADKNSLQMLFLVPRVLMGILAVVDTFLIYKISELRYNRSVAFVASVLFAIMPITWLTRWILLDTLQIPFFLLSILFALSCRSAPSGGNHDKVNNNNNKILKILLSGIFLGLAIFTKVTLFTMIPLVGFLVLKHCSSTRRLEVIGLWLIPVVFIPLLWPAYAISIGQFQNWLTDVDNQTYRTGWPLSVSIDDFFKTDTILFFLGITGLVFAAIKRDFFILLLVIPYLVFLSFIGYVSTFHLIPLAIGFCLAAGRLITEISYKISHKKFQQSVFAITFAIGAFGIVNTAVLITSNDNSHYFDAAAFVNKYLEKNKDNGGNTTDTITVISTPFYLWLPLYKFHLDNYIGWIPQVIKTEKLLLIVDNEFRGVLSSPLTFREQLFQKKGLSLPFTTGEKYQKIVNSYATETLTTFGNDHATVLLTDLSHNNPNSTAINLIDQTHVWKASKHAKVSQNNNSLNIMVKTVDTNKEFNHAVLETYMNLKERPLLLSLEYASNAIFTLQIKDNGNDTILWSKDLDNSSGKLVRELIFLPREIIGPVEVGLNTVTQGVGDHFFSVKKAIVI
jgi:hypothetical protein